MKTQAMRLIEYERGQPIEEILTELADRGYSIQEIAGDLGITIVTFYRWCDLLQAELGRRRTIRFPHREQVAST